MWFFMTNECAKDKKRPEHCSKYICLQIETYGFILHPL